MWFFSTAYGQKDTAVYYLTNSGHLVSTKDSADLFFVILPPDTNIDKKLFRVHEFYANGKIRLMGMSTTNNLDVKFQGSQVTYFPNGHKMRIANFNEGEPVGDAVEYYPNGKLYNIKTYAQNRNLFLKQYNDSTGIVLAENGKGEWVDFLDERFRGAYEKGKISNGLKEGLWNGRINDTLTITSAYKRGNLIFSDSRRYGIQVHTKVDLKPEYPGGYPAFGKFIGRNMRYPAAARENNTQGTVIVNFGIEKDGTLTNVRVAKGIGDGCDEEAIRVIKLSSPWKPGYLNGVAIAVFCSVPVNYTLATE